MLAAALVAAACICGAAAAYELRTSDYLRRMSISYDEAEDVTSISDAGGVLSDDANELSLVLRTRGEIDLNDGDDAGLARADLWPVVSMRAQLDGATLRDVERITVDVDGEILRVADIPDEDVSISDDTLTISSTHAATHSLHVWRKIGDACRGVRVRVQDSRSRRIEWTLDVGQVIAVRHMMELYDSIGRPLVDPWYEVEFDDLVMGRCEGSAVVERQTDVIWDFEYEAFAPEKLQRGRVLRVSQWQERPPYDHDDGIISVWFLAFDDDGEELGWICGEDLDLSGVKIDEQSAEPNDDEWKRLRVDTLSSWKTTDIEQRVMLELFADLRGSRGIWQEAESFEIPYEIDFDDTDAIRKPVRTFRAPGRTVQIVERYLFGEEDPISTTLFAYRASRFDLGVRDGESADDVERYFRGRHAPRAEEDPDDPSRKILLMHTKGSQFGYYDWWESCTDLTISFVDGAASELLLENTSRFLDGEIQDKAESLRTLLPAPEREQIAGSEASHDGLPLAICAAAFVAAAAIAAACARRGGSKGEGSQDG